MLFHTTHDSNDGTGAPGSFRPTPMPLDPRPIVIIGAGGIVNDAHLPAYRKAGFPVAGIMDTDRGRAESVARKFSIPVVFASVGEAAAQPGVVFDLAVPPEQLLGILEKLPEGAVVLMQKPMGADLAGAREIRRVCRERKLVAAVNFQLRFSPMMLALGDAISRGLIGTIADIEVRLNIRTHWDAFPFLKDREGFEILLHSIHYLDLIRGWLGEPRGVHARTVGHPSPAIKAAGTSIILDYGDKVRCSLALNHNYVFGPAHEAATFSIQGVNGAAVATLGLLMNYPDGKPETLELVTGDGPWTAVPLEGRWFPDAFIGRMANLQRFAAGEDATLVSDFEDAFRTMALVEACHDSDRRGATPIPD